MTGDVRFTVVETGGTACGLDSDGRAYCWGYDFAGNLGSEPAGMCGTDPCTPNPAPVLGNHSFVAIGVGSAHACALTADGTAWCWGVNNLGQLGNGKILPPKPPTYFGERTPVKVISTVPFVAIDAGQYNTCAISAAGAAYCWGANTAGQLGIGSTSNDPALTPVAVGGGLTFSSINVGSQHVCALTPTGVGYCWGLNSSQRLNGGALGIGTYEDRMTPTKVAGDLTFVELRTRGPTTCGRVASGKVYCWGGNFFGQLGVANPRIANVNRPSGVRGIP